MLTKKFDAMAAELAMAHADDDGQTGEHPGETAAAA
jgi:hypothetical protein